MYKNLLTAIIVVTCSQLFAQFDAIQFELGPTFSKSEVFSDVFAYEHTFLQDGSNRGLSARLRLSYFFIEGRMESGSYKRINEANGDFFESKMKFYDATLGFEYDPDWLIGMSDVSWSLFIGGTVGRASGSHKNHLEPQASYPEQGLYWGGKGGIRIDWNSDRFYIPNIQVEYSYQRITNDLVLDGLGDNYDTRQSISVSLLFPLVRQP